MVTPSDGTVGDQPDRAGQTWDMEPAAGTPGGPAPSAGDAVIYTIGHSTRPQAEFIGLLKHYGITTLADVRTVPRSRHNPQFNRDVLSDVLPEAGIVYEHIAELGGLRHGLGAASPNPGWRNQSFRGYADHMQTSEFAAGLERLLTLARNGPVAVMCAEAVPWRCHRSLIADALLVRGIDTADIQNLDHTLPHKLTPFSRMDGTGITYPAPDGDAGAAGPELVQTSLDLNVTGPASGDTHER